MKFDNIYTWLVILGIIIISVNVLKVTGLEMIKNPEADLSNNSIYYIMDNILGLEFEETVDSVNADDLNLDKYNLTKDDLEKNQLDLKGNDTGVNLKDFAIEFFYSQSTAVRFYNTVKDSYLYISYFARLLLIPDGVIDWILNPLNFILNLMILLAGYKAIRGIQ